MVFLSPSGQEGGGFVHLTGLAWEGNAQANSFLSNSCYLLGAAEALDLFLEAGDTVK